MPGPGRTAVNIMKALAGFGGRGSRGGLLTTGLMGAGFIGAGKAMSALSDTPWGREQAPATRAMMGLGSAGLQLGGYMAIGRGAIGSAQAGYDRAVGRTLSRFDRMGGKLSSSRMYLAAAGARGGAAYRAAGILGRSKLPGIDARVTGTFNNAKSLLGGPMYRGSPMNRLVTGGALGRGLWGAAKFPVRTGLQMVTGTVDAIAQGIPNAARFFFGGGAGRSVQSLMYPKSLFGKMPFLKEGRAAMGAGLFTIAGGAAVGAQYINQRGDQMSGWKGGAQDFNPADYGQGFYAMRRGSASNYGPALTLALHRNNSRVMP